MRPLGDLLLDFGLLLVFFAAALLTLVFLDGGGQ